MSKKVKQTLTGAMAAMMATGIVATPVMADTTSSVDAIYRSAFEATQKALETKTQESINLARAAIKALPESFDWAIGEFSKQLDGVQHPILVNIVTSIKTAQTEKTQASVNAAKASLVAGLPQVWLNSYSSAVDIVQQEIIDNVVEAVKLAETSRIAENIEAAKKLVADLGTATSEGIKTVAAGLEKRVNEVKPYDLTIKTAVISKLSIKVTFDKLVEAVKAATLEVKDNKGNIVAVDAKITTLIEDETEATFYFTKPLSEKDMVGVWTVNGYKVNLDHANLIADAKEAAAESTTNDAEKNAAKLFSVLADSKLVEGLVDTLANQKAYHEGLKKAFSENKITTLADLQKVIDAANLEVKTEVKAYDLVVTAKTGTYNQFKDLASKSGLKRVNEEFLQSYKDSFKDEYTQTNITYTELQKIVDAKNLLEVDRLFNSKNEVANYTLINKKNDGTLDSSLVNKYIGYVENYMVLDEESDSYEADKKVKELRLKNLSITLAMTDVNSADTKASLKSALSKLEKAVDDEKVFSYAKLVNENLFDTLLKSNYHMSEKKNAYEVSDVKDILENVYVEAYSTTVKAVHKAMNDAKQDGMSTAEKAQLIKDLKTLEAISALNNNVMAGKDVSIYNKFDYSIVNEVILDQYVSAYNLVADTAGTINASYIDLLMKQIDGINKNQFATSVLSIIKNTGTVEIPAYELEGTKEEAITLLTKLGVKGIVSDNLTNDDLVEIGKLGLNSAVKLTDVQNAINLINAKKTVATSYDAKAVSEALTVIALQDATSLEGVNFTKLSTSQRLDTAELYIASRVATTTKDLKTQVSEANAKLVAALDNINLHGTVQTAAIDDTPAVLFDKFDEVKDALKFIIDGFEDLNSLEQYENTMLFLENRPTKEVVNPDTKEVSKVLVKITSLSEVRSIYETR